MDDNSDPEIKISDRRRFTSEGALRDGESADTAAQEQSAKAAPEQPQQPKPQPQKSAPQEKIAAGDEYPAVDFSSFVISLATQTLVMLGEAPHPETGTISPNLEAARQTIDVLSMLEQKTTGNLNADEEKLVSEVLANLRMAYVNRVQGGTVGN